MERTMEGFYAMYYTGGTGSGHALFIMKDGKIIGADVVGGVLDGSYESDEGGNIAFKVNLTVPAGATLVTGQTAGAAPVMQEISASLPRTFADGQARPVRTPLGPVNIIFRHLRDLQ
jgi:hypothetical protein